MRGGLRQGRAFPGAVFLGAAIPGAVFPKALIPGPVFPGSPTPGPAFPGAAFPGSAIPELPSLDLFSWELHSLELFSLDLPSPELFSLDLPSLEFSPELFSPDLPSPELCAKEENAPNSGQILWDPARKPLGDTRADGGRGQRDVWAPVGGPHKELGLGRFGGDFGDFSLILGSRFVLGLNEVPPAPGFPISRVLPL